LVRPRSAAKRRTAGASACHEARDGLAVARDRHLVADLGFSERLRKPGLRLMRVDCRHRCACAA
jgi:hypothetical protein